MLIAEVAAYLVALVPARVAVWPALGGVGAALATSLREGRRRMVLNEHLHEVRRPLQALALMKAPGEPGGEDDDGAIEMVAAALARLEREINGERGAGARAVFAVRPLLESARRRWAMQAALCGTPITLRWDAEEAAVAGDRIELAGALDNLIANALEHGGSRIELAADLLDGRVCLAVVDSGAGAGRRAREREARRRDAAGRRAPAVPFHRGHGREEKRAREVRASLRRLSGRERHGHGLRLVRRAAARHDGAFALHMGELGTSAVLELPLAPRGGSR